MPFPPMRKKRELSTCKIWQGLNLDLLTHHALDPMFMIATGGGIGKSGEEA